MAAGKGAEQHPHIRRGLILALTGPVGPGRARRIRSIAAMFAATSEAGAARGGGLRAVRFESHFKRSFGLCSGL